MGAGRAPSAVLGKLSNTGGRFLAAGVTFLGDASYRARGEGAALSWGAFCLFLGLLEIESETSRISVF